MEFIPAKESKPFIFVFRWYTWLLFKRRFRNVWLRQEYHPDKNGKTVYYLNHHSWWDGLIPFLLNEFRFHQNARALMEDFQMGHYPFFRKLGAFSIDRENPRRAITSLRYAVQSMQRDRASLFIYPAGKITPAGSAAQFEGGLAWLHSKVNTAEVDFVPVGIYMHMMRHDKPELYLHIAEAVTTEQSLSNEDKTTYFEQKLQSVLDEMKATAGFKDEGFEPLM